MRGEAWLGSIDQDENLRLEEQVRRMQAEHRVALQNGASGSGGCCGSRPK
jgi:hypothetical protein